MTRVASCRCGQLTAACEGEPIRISVCHCLNCQKRSGSSFAAQARFPIESVVTTGRSASWSEVGDSGNRFTQYFCPDCGSTVHYTINDAADGLVAIPVGAFADPQFPPPEYSVYESRKHRWVDIVGGSVDHYG